MLLSMDCDCYLTNERNEHRTDCRYRTEEGATFVIAPCKGCGSDIQDEGPVDDTWWCSSCWPNEDRRRLRAEVARLKAEVSDILPQADAVAHMSTRAVRAETRVAQLESALRWVESHGGHDAARIAHAALAPTKDFDPFAPIDQLPEDI